LELWIFFGILSNQAFRQEFYWEEEGVGNKENVDVLGIDCSEEFVHPDGRGLVLQDRR